MRLGLLLSGGDCSGLNNAIYGVLTAAHNNNIEILLFNDGFSGLSKCDFFTINKHNDLLYYSSIFSGSIINSTPRDFYVNDNIDAIKKACNDLSLNGIIGIGGNGGITALSFLKEYIPVTAIPKTIDNDVYGTEYCIGFDTAVSNNAEMIDNISSTMRTHNRVMIVETMGRDVGYLALYSGIACNADIILIPEIKYNIEILLASIYKKMQHKKGCLIVISEAICDITGKSNMLMKDGRKIHYDAANFLAQHIANNTNFSVRSSVLGYVQRGGKPTCKDRINAYEMGITAVNNMLQKNTGNVVVYQENIINSVEIDNIKGKTNNIQEQNVMLKKAKNFGICLGDSV